jgi:hypothetical protein
MSAINYGSVLQSLLSSVKAPPEETYRNPVAGMRFANQANAQRGQSILQLLSGIGESSMQDNQDNFKGQEAQIRQSMMDKGLSNTTVGNNLDQEAQNQLAQNNLRTRESVGGNLASMASSFTQAGPNMDAVSRLLSEGGSAGRIVEGPQAMSSWRPFQQQ